MILRFRVCGYWDKEDQITVCKFVEGNIGVEATESALLI